MNTKELSPVRSCMALNPKIAMLSCVAASYMIRCAVAWEAELRAMPSATAEVRKRNDASRACRLTDRASAAAPRVVRHKWNSTLTGGRRQLQAHVRRLLWVTLPGHRREDGEAPEKSDDFRDRDVAELDGVHVDSGDAPPAAVTRQGLPVRDAQDRVLGDDHRMPFHYAVAAPDPHRSVRFDRCRLIDTTPSPMGAACGQQDRCKERAAHYGGADVAPPRRPLHRSTHVAVAHRRLACRRPAHGWGNAESTMHFVACCSSRLTDRA